MSIEVRADAAALDAFATNRLHRFVITFAIGSVVTGAILAVEYRLMIVTLIAMAPSLIALAELVRARRARALSFVSVSIDDSSVTIADGRDRRTLSASTIVARVTPRFALVAHVPSASPAQGWTVPGDRDALRALGDALASRGARVVYEGEAAELILGVLGGVVAQIVLRVVATGLALGGIANIALRLFGSGGSLATGLGLLAASCGVLVVGALLGRVVRR